MAKPIGGTCYFKIDGAQLTLASEDVTVNIQETSKEGVVPGYFTEKDLIPSIEVEAVVPADFPFQTIADMTDGVITVELKSGLTAVLSGAYLAGEAGVEAGKGTRKMKFEGKKGTWQ
jgi:hypothetical protein